MSRITERLGAHLGDRYRFERELGAGGMATVYLAHDLRHDRQVAIKVLHEDLGFALGAERFLTEIRTTARLQHPHILPLLDSGSTAAEGESGGLLYYVMPYVAGESLRDRLTRERQLPLEDALRITREVADALGHAHAQGIVHRDIKPENVLLQGGHALVADFGIALAVQSAGGARLTQTGISLGTPQYMSPEQAMGERTVDARSDVYALGAVLYEMLTGEPPFAGATVAAVVAKVLGTEPAPPTAIRKTVPEHVEGAVLKALAKLPADRWGSTAEFVAGMAGADGRATPRGSLVGTRPLRRPGALSVGALVCAAFGVWVGTFLVRSAPATLLPLVQFTLTPGRVGEPWLNAPIALAPDGSALVYTGFNEDRMWQLFIRRIDRDGVEPLSGTVDGSLPFFSPTGEWVGFFQAGSLKKVAVEGGQVSTICEVSEPQGHLMFGRLPDVTWGSADTIVFVQEGRLLRVSASGGRPSLLAGPDSAAGVRGFTSARFIADTRSIVVAFLTLEGDTSLGTLSLDEPVVRPLPVAGTAPRYVDPGYLVFANSEGGLLAVPFDGRRLVVRGSAFPVTAALGEVAVAPVSSRTGSGGVFDASRSGVLVFGARRETDKELVIADRSGGLRVLRVPPGPWVKPRLSPDARRLVALRQARSYWESGSLWMYDLETERLQLLVADSSSTRPQWTGDGEVVIGRRQSDGTQGLFKVEVEGEGTLEMISPRSGVLSPDGGTLVHECFTSGMSRDICMTPLDVGAAVQPLVASPSDEMNVAISPDGRWIAFVADATGQNDVYVRPLGREGRTRPVSLDGGTEPRWAKGGSEILFRRGDSIFVAGITMGPEPRIDTPRRLLFGKLTPASTYSQEFDVSSDGSLIVMLRPVGEGSLLEYRYVLNWLGQLAPSR